MLSSRLFSPGIGNGKSRPGSSAALRLARLYAVGLAVAGIVWITWGAGCRQAESPAPAPAAVEEVEGLSQDQPAASPSPQEPPKTATFVLGHVDPVEISAGEEVARELKVDRAAVQGAVQLDFQNVPDGIVISPAEIPADADSVALKIRAEDRLADAQLLSVVIIRAKAGDAHGSGTLSLAVAPVVLPKVQPPVEQLVRPGEEIVVPVKLDRGACKRPVQIRLENAPSGVTAEPVIVPEGSETAELRIRAAADAAEGRHSVKLAAVIAGKSSGADFPLSVQRSPYRINCFRVVTLKPGETQEVAIPVERRGYTGPIHLEFENLPDKVSAAPVDVPPGGTSVKIRFTAEKDAKERVRSVYIRSRAGSLSTRDPIIVRVSWGESGFLPREITFDPEIAPLLRRGSFGGRLTSQAKAALCDAYGGTPESQQAVLRGLRWLAAHQESDGRWSLKNYGRTLPGCDCHLSEEAEAEIVDDDTAGTALALLPFLAEGIGPTTAPEEPADLPRYRNLVRRGLTWLMKKQVIDLQSEKDGHLGGSTYCHAAATIALCEAYALTGDEQLQIAAQRAIKYLMNAQHTAGGWRYGFREAGDMSVVSWVFLAIRSGQLAGLRIDSGPLTRAARFIDTCAVGPEPVKLSEYCYQPGREPSNALTAAGLLTRQYLGWPKDNPHLQAGCKKIAQALPPAEGSNAGPLNLYFYYYATEVLHHMEGEDWDLWNHRMRELLIRTQEKSGHREGSWSPEGTVWGKRGGRIYTTSLALMTLQVYYRHLPLYRPVVRGQAAGTHTAAGR
ncbi:MAG: hypothetical protein GYA33_00275 [Thermogutta sp.]|nr:hypothetical protein [Thermogutta sp.]